MFQRRPFCGASIIIQQIAHASSIFMENQAEVTTSEENSTEQLAD